jgi:hypothetical protein
MIKRCINSECRNEFRHLHAGNLYALDRGVSDTQFVWMCADCAPKLAIAIDAAGTISLQGRMPTTQSGSGSRTVPASHAARLRLLSSYEPKGLWYASDIRAGSRAPDHRPAYRLASIEAA